MLTEDDIKVWKQYTQNISPKGIPAPGFPRPKPAVNSPLVNWNPVIDLHGMTIQDAYDNLFLFIEKAKYLNEKYITVITGKSGEILLEFPHWVKNKVKSYQLLPNGGSWKLKL